MDAIAADDTARHGIGGNDPPLAEILVEEVAPLKERAQALAEGVGRALITDGDSAKRGTLLAGQIKTHLDKIDEARVTRKAPYLEGVRAVDGAFGALTGMLATFDKGKLNGGPLFVLMGRIAQHQRDEEAKAAEEKRRLEGEAQRLREAAEESARKQCEAEERERLAAEQRKRDQEAAEQRELEAVEAANKRARDAAAAAVAANDAAALETARRQKAEADLARQKAENEAAERKRQEAAAEEKRQVAAREAKLQAEIEEERRLKDAEALEKQAAATRAAPIDSGLGVKAHRRSVWSARITDLTVAIRHARRIDEAAVRAAIQQIYDKQVRAGIRVLPGAEIDEDRASSIKGG